MSMACPNDGTTLMMAERAGVQIDYCPECRGVWLERGALDRIIEHSGARDEHDRRDDRHDHRHDDRHDGRTTAGTTATGTTTRTTSGTAASAAGSATSPGSSAAATTDRDRGEQPEGTAGTFSTVPANE